MPTNARRLIVLAALLGAGALAAWLPALVERGRTGGDVMAGAVVTDGTSARMFVADTNWWMRTPDQSVVASRYDLSIRGSLPDFPRRLAGWSGTDMSGEGAKLLGFAPEQQMYRFYRDGGASLIWLRLLASTDLKMFYHVPTVCYTNNNWALEPESSYPIDIGSSVLNARGFLASQGPTTHLVLYSFLWPDKYRATSAGATMYEIIAPVSGGDREGARQRLADFTRLIFTGEPALAARSFEASHRTDANLGDKVTLLGYDLSGEELRPGETLSVTLYWQARTAIGQDYTAFVHLLNRKEDQGRGMVMAQEDRQPFGGLYPTSRWQAGQVMKDTYRVTVPEDAAPGERQLEVGMYLVSTGRRLGVVGLLGRQRGDSVFLRSIQVTGQGAP